MDGAFVSNIQYLNLKKSPNVSDDVHPLAGAVPCAGPKEMFDPYSAIRNHGECQLCIMH